MILLFLLLCIHYINGYMYTLKTKIINHNLISKNTQKDILKLYDYEACKIIKYWHDEATKENIDYNLDNTIEFTTFLHEDYKNENEYLLWMPKIDICLPTYNVIKNNSYSIKPFHHSLSLVCFETNKNNIIIKSIANNPFWKDKEYYLNDEIKKVLNEYFLNILKHNEIKFNNMKMK